MRKTPFPSRSLCDSVIDFIFVVYIMQESFLTKQLQFNLHEYQLSKKMKSVYLQYKQHFNLPINSFGHVWSHTSLVGRGEIEMKQFNQWGGQGKIGKTQNESKKVSVSISVSVLLWVPCARCV